ncbi:chorismate mutase [Thalassococcus sp. S3]|uniref:chorismate mutase n=1 Tax=Thalassococcus sp. S3 TaxID=2017482 RepID=UPI0010247198|nr:chorismate mutase [Thalassococcus sp. S3]QBF32967.1 chorismate mutase [Thalassococcus sp. S3]
MRAPQDCTNMAELRAAIDELDREIVAKLAQRARYIDRAAELKRENGLPANIPARVEEVVSRVRTTAGEAGFDADLAETIWRAMIDWSIAREEQHLGS